MVLNIPRSRNIFHSHFIIPLKNSVIPNHRAIIPFLIVLFCCFLNNFQYVSCTDDSGVKLPTKCETCKYMSLELEQRFAETGKTNEVLRTGSPLMGNQKTTKYRNSELRLIETLENVCDRILQYNMHKEHDNSLRFAKGQSTTMNVLHGLVEKGVKVELGIPYDLWDSPSVEVTTMKQHCEYILEMYENEIEHWYFDENENKPSLMKYLCEDRVLKTAKDRSCLAEVDEKKKGDDGSETGKKGSSSSSSQKTQSPRENSQRKSSPDSSTDTTTTSGKTVNGKRREKNRKGDDEL